MTEPDDGSNPQFSDSVPVMLKGEDCHNAAAVGTEPRLLRSPCTTCGYITPHTLVTMPPFQCRSHERPGSGSCSAVYLCLGSSDKSVLG